MVLEWDAELGGDEEPGSGWALVRAALGAFSDARALKAIEDHRQGRMTMQEWLRSGLGEMRLAVRGLLRTRSFAAISVVTLALGIGGSAAIFTLLDRVVLDPLPYPDAERLVRLENQVPGVGAEEVWPLSTAQWVYFAERATTLDGVGIYRGIGGNILTPSGPQRTPGVRVTASMMELLGAQARLGRLITEVDDAPGAAPVALLSFGFWQRTLGSDPDVVGRTLTYDDRPIEVIGVLSPGLSLPGWPPSFEPEIWVPMQVDRAGRFANNHTYPAIGRLAPGATPAEAEAEIGRLTTRLPEAYPQAYQQGFLDRYGFRTQVVPLKDSVVGDVASRLWIVFGGVGLVLLIACANVVNLFLARMEGRRRELMVRSALGAGRSALARHLFAEALTLASIGGTLGLLVAAWGVPTLASLAPDSLPRMNGLGVGVQTIAFTFGLSFAVAIGLVIYPILTHTGSRAVGDLSEGGRTTSEGKNRRRFRGGLIMIQVALALTLAVGAGLLMETLRALRHTDLGFEPDQVVSVDLYLSRIRYPDDVAIWNFHRELLSRVRGLPGVGYAAFGEEVPVTGGFGCTVQGFEDQAVMDRIAEAGLTTCAGQERVTPGYFETLGIPVLEGRALTAGDNDDPTRGSVVVSRAFAERFWPGESALGKGIAPSGRTVEPWYRVVGVVGDVPAASGEGQAPFSQTAVAVYYPIRHNPDTPGNWDWWWPGQASLIVKAESGDGLALLPALRHVVDELDPEVPFANATEMESAVVAEGAKTTFVALLLGIAAATAILLAAVGLYGVISYTVNRRAREVGMRIAIGARAEEVQWMVVGQSVRLAMGGLAGGIVLALGVTRLLGSLLVGVKPASPISYLGACALLALISVVASWLPARRASRVDPVEALRAE